MAPVGFRLLLALASAAVVASCNSPAPPPRTPTPPPPFYRLTGLIRASCFVAPASVGQGYCALHGQIQNEGGPGRGAIGELILEYRAKDSDQLVTARCDSVIPPLNNKDVAEVDCFVLGDPLIYSDRIVSTEITFLPLVSPAPASGARAGGHSAAP